MTSLLLSPRAASAFRFSACSRVSPQSRRIDLCAQPRRGLSVWHLAVRAAPATKRVAQCGVLKYCCDCGALARICAAGGTTVLGVNCNENSCARAFIAGKKAQLITHRDINSTEAGRLSLAVMPKTARYKHKEGRHLCTRIPR